MVWSGGTFTRIDGTTGFQDDEAAGTGIESGIMDTAFNDLATDGINQTLNKAGQNSPTANLPMGGFKHTGAAAASSNDQYTTQGQLKDNSFTAELEALEIAPTSADTAINVTAKSGATGRLVDIKDNSSNTIFYVGNAGTVGINTTSTSSQFAVRTPSLTGPCVGLVQTELANTEGVGWQVVGYKNGGAVRQCVAGVYKHSGITEACAYLFIESANSANNHLWFDDSSILRTGGLLSLVGTTGGTVIGTQTSDERLKDIEPDFGYGLEQVKALKPIAYVRKDDPEQVRRIGFGAQTTQPIVPEAVYDTREEIEGEDPLETKLAMDYATLIPVLVKAIQELEAKVASLEAQVTP
jgi:hypothetical protein